MKEVAYSPEAEEDLFRLRQHFPDDTWERIHTRILSTVNFIRTYPEMYPLVGTRRRAVCVYSRNIRLNIYYRASGNAIIVLRIVAGPIDV